MGKKYRTARGEIIDIDLLRLKQNLTAKPITTAIQAREQYVDDKSKHRFRRKKMPPLPKELLNKVGQRRVNEAELKEVTPVPIPEVTPIPIPEVNPEPEVKEESKPKRGQRARPPTEKTTKTTTNTPTEDNKDEPEDSSNT